LSKERLTRSEKIALALNRRKDVNVYLLKLENYDPAWPKVPLVELFNEADARTLNEDIPHVAPEDEIEGKADLTIRVTIDFDPPKIPSKKMAVMLTSEKGILLNEGLYGALGVGRGAKRRVEVC